MITCEVYMQDLEKRDKKIKSWIYEIKCMYERGELSIQKIDTKSNVRDLVTSVDRQVEKYLDEQIKVNYPNESIIGEESYNCETFIETEHVWTIDPIDATANFVKQQDDFAILISYFVNRQPKLSYIYNVTQDKLLWSMKGKGVFLNDRMVSVPNNISLAQSLVSIDVQKMRNTPLLDKIINESFDIRYIGCAGLDGTKVILGQFGGYICPNLKPWDYSPFLLIADELGLHVSNFNGEPIPFGKSSDFIISTNKFFEDLNIKGGNQ